MTPLVIFGEVLFDCFDDEAVLGGAPFNVAWNLRGFGLDPVLISRVGADGRGEAVRTTMGSWGLDARGLQTDTGRPTGMVTITLEGGEPTFAILPDQAYDRIDAGEAEPLFVYLPVVRK